MLGGFILVTILALYHEDKKEVTPKKKTNWKGKEKKLNFFYKM
jgi:hypothetical protein